MKDRYGELNWWPGAVFVLAAAVIITLTVIAAATPSWGQERATLEEEAMLRAETSFAGCEHAVLSYELDALALTARTATLEEQVRNLQALVVERTQERDDAQAIADLNGDAISQLQALLETRTQERDAALAELGVLRDRLEALRLWVTQWMEGTLETTKYTNGTKEDLTTDNTESTDEMNSTEVTP